MSLRCDLSRLAPRARAILRPPRSPDSATLEHPGRITRGQGHLQIHTRTPNGSHTPILIAVGRPPPNRGGEAKNDRKRRAHSGPRWAGS